MEFSLKSFKKGNEHDISCSEQTQSSAYIGCFDCFGYFGRFVTGLFSCKGELLFSLKPFKNGNEHDISCSE